jgi:hypothetical protein
LNPQVSLFFDSISECRRSSLALVPGGLDNWGKMISLAPKEFAMETKMKTITGDLVELVPVADPATGGYIYRYPSPDSSMDAVPAAGVDVVLRPDGALIKTATADPAETQLISRLPEGRMATSSSWDEIAEELRLSEEGGSNGAEVVLKPGGGLEISRGDEAPRPLSKLPEGRMAAAAPGPSSADVEVLRRLDPQNLEGWEPVDDGELTGWVFRLTPPETDQTDFAFFAFRSPSDGNAWRISVLEPDMDYERGHGPHMISVSVGGMTVPVICGPGGAPARTLQEVRTHAAKWMAYTSRRMGGLNPGFSR